MISSSFTFLCPHFCKVSKILLGDKNFTTRLALQTETDIWSMIKSKITSHGVLDGSSHDKEIQVFLILFYEENQDLDPYTNTI